MSKQEILKNLLNGIIEETQSDNSFNQTLEQLFSCKKESDNLFSKDSYSIAITSPICLLADAYFPSNHTPKSTAFRENEILIELDNNNIIRRNFKKDNEGIVYDMKYNMYTLNDNIDKAIMIAASMMERILSSKDSHKSINSDMLGRIGNIDEYMSKKYGISLPDAIESLQNKPEYATDKDETVKDSMSLEEAIANISNYAKVVTRFNGKPSENVTLLENEKSNSIYIGTTEKYDAPGLKIGDKSVSFDGSLIIDKNNEKPSRIEGVTFSYDEISGKTTLTSPNGIYIKVDDDGISITGDSDPKAIQETLDILDALESIESTMGGKDISYKEIMDKNVDTAVAYGKGSSYENKFAASKTYPTPINRLEDDKYDSKPKVEKYSKEQDTSYQANVTSGKFHGIDMPAGVTEQLAGDLTGSWAGGIKVDKKPKIVKASSLSNFDINEDAIWSYQQAMDKVINGEKKNTYQKKTLSEEFASAGYRVAATQANKAVVSSIVAVLRKQGTDNNTIANISSFLETEYGAAMISFLLGNIINQVPSLGKNEKVERLADELRVNGMTIVGNELVSNVISSLLPAMKNIINALPENEKVRVEESKTISKEIVYDEETPVTEELVPKTYTLN